jgi:hypothetical protein
MTSARRFILRWAVVVVAVVGSGGGKRWWEAVVQLHRSGA